MKDLPPLSGIAAFIGVAEPGAFNEAARQLGLSPSATSKAVSRLEEYLGTKLLHRTTRSLSLTPEGTRYLSGAREILDELRVLGEEVSNTSAGPRGRVRLSAPAAFGRIWLVDALNEFQKRWPAVKVELNLEDRLVDLAGEAIDVAIRDGSLDNVEYLVAKKIFRSELVTCASPEYWRTHGRPSHPDELSGFDCLNFRSHQTGRIYPWYYSTANEIDSMILPSHFETDDGSAILAASIAGMGISQMPSYLAKQSLDAGVLEEVLVDFRPDERQFHLLYLERKLLSPRVRVLIDFLIEYDLDKRVRI